MTDEPSPRFHSEFARSVEAVRLDIAGESAESRPVLLIKATTLKLKYLVRLRTFRLLLWMFPSSRHLWYGVQIADDPIAPATLWSIVEHDAELAAVQQLINGEQISIHLLNEEDINVASAIVAMRFGGTDAGCPFGDVVVAEEGSWRQYQSETEELLAPTSATPFAEAAPSEPCAWIENHSILITQHFDRCSLAMITGDEGDQQESLSHWLIDILAAPTAVRNPVVHEQRRTRELSDLLLSHPYGSFLIESKSLAIFDREQIPDRSSLKRSVLKHLKKAISQLAGGCANIGRGLRVTDSKGNEIQFTRDWPVHCIIVVPELSLIADCEGLAPELTFSLLRGSRAFLNLVDLSELHNLVYNAGSLASASRELTRMMAFDAILMKRCEVAGRQKTPDVRFRMSLRSDLSAPGASESEQ